MTMSRRPKGSYIGFDDVALAKGGDEAFVERVRELSLALPSTDSQKK